MANIRPSGVKEETEKKNPLTKATTVIKALSLGGAQGGGGPCAVDVKDDKIIRIRPLHFDWKYNKAQFNPWKIRRNGKAYEPLMKSLVAPFSLAYKKGYIHLTE